MTNPGWAAAIGCAVLLILLNSAIWLMLSQAANGVKRSRLSGIRLPSLMKSEDAWRAGHIAAQRVMPPFLIAALGLAVVSVPLQLVPVAYVVALGVSLLFSVLSLIVGSVAASRAARGIKA